MNKRFFPLALAVLSAAHTTRSRAGFDDFNPLLAKANFIDSGEGGEGGGDSTASTGASTEEQQQSQQQAQADAAPQADDVKVDDSETGAGQQAQAVGDPPAGTDQQT